MSSWISVILFVGAIATLLSYVAAIAVAFSQMKQHSRPAKLLIAGVSVWLFAYLATTGLNIAWTNFVTPSQMAIYSVAMSLANAVLRLVGLGCVVAAVFADRTHNGPTQSQDFLPGDQTNSDADPNPFAPPK